MKKKIVLIGMMGSGKSTIGKILSKMLKFNFIDTDILIEKKCGLKITKIFDKYGEEYFRRKEEKIVSKILCYKSSFVISLGGGVFLNKNLQKQILKKTISIWLKPSFKTIYDRCKKSNHRPLIKNKNDLRFNLKKLIKKRYPIYSKANITITLNNTPRVICNNIIKRLNIIINL